MSLIPIILGVATVLGGIAALLYFWDRIRPPDIEQRQQDNKSPVTVFPVAGNGKFKGSPENLAKLVDEVRHSRLTDGPKQVEVRLASLASVRRKYRRLDSKRHPSSSDVRHLQHLGAEIARLEEATERSSQCVSAIINEPLLNHRGILSDSRKAAECIHWLLWLCSGGAKPFNPWKEGCTGVDVYRLHPPELSGTTWLLPNEAAELDRIDPSGITLGMRARWSVIEFSDPLLRKRIIPLVVTTTVRAARQGLGPLGSDVFDLQRWYFGLH